MDVVALLTRVRITSIPHEVSLLYHNLCNATEQDPVPAYVPLAYKNSRSSGRFEAIFATLGTLYSILKQRFAAPGESRIPPLSSLLLRLIFSVWLGLALYCAWKRYTVLGISFIISGICLVIPLLILFRLHLRYNRILFFFFTDSIDVLEGTFGGYLRKIRQSTQVPFSYRFLPFIAVLRDPYRHVYIRVPSKFQNLPRRTRTKIVQIVSVALRLSRVADAYHGDDRYLLARFIITQRLPEIAVALCSLWALTLGTYKVFGGLVVWSLLMITVVVFNFRLVGLVRSLRMWAPSLKYLNRHPAFEKIQIVYPKELALWQNRSAAIIAVHNMMVAWIIQAFLGIYILLFTQMIGWCKSGSIWLSIADIILFRC